MDDPIWKCLDSTKNLSREQLELVLQKRKINEVFGWFSEHFRCTHAEYTAKCPIAILQGPTGSGKTSTLRWISNELKIPIKEYSETTDLTAINFELAKAFTNEERANLSQAIDKKKALKFECYVITSLRYNTLYPVDNSSGQEATADSEFDSDDEFLISSSRPSNPPPVSGIIIHIESPLTFARSQRILIQSLHRLIKTIKSVSQHIRRRVAIVFETLENDGESFSLPTKLKVSLGIQMFKFNPVTRANMKKLIDSVMKNYPFLMIDKDTIDQIVSDCDGDMRACLNSLQLICNRPTRTDRNSENSHHRRLGLQLSPIHLPANKKQKLNHTKAKHVKLDANLLRDGTKSFGFFHVLGKILYQKRLYPEHTRPNQTKRIRSIDRPFPTENSTEYLASMLGVDPRNLIAWLHQHYHRFCGHQDIAKAALFLDNLSTVDTISLNSMQSSQFYENHTILDDLQTHLAIESTVYSLYEDQRNLTKSSHKPTLVGNEYVVVKSSVSTGSNGELYSFNKPTSMTLAKLVTDYQSVLDFCNTRLIESSSTAALVDSSKTLTDYVPYLRCMAGNWSLMSPATRANHFSVVNQHPLFDDGDTTRVLEALDHFEEKSDTDLEQRHEQLLAMIEVLDYRQRDRLTEQL